MSELCPLQRRAAILGLLALGILPYALNSFYLPLLARHPVWFWTYDVTAVVALPLAIFTLGTRGRLFRTDELGFTDRIRGQRRDLAFVVTLVVAIPLLFWSYSAGREVGKRAFARNYGERDFRYLDVLPPPGPTTGGNRLLAVFYLAASAAVAEELYFRGMMRRLFGERPLHDVIYVPASAVLFAAIHWKFGVYEACGAFSFGLAAAALFTVTRTLWPLILGHFLIDLHYLLI